MTPVLNWRELALLIERLRPALQGMHVDRIVVPERPVFPQGYLKSELAFRLTSRRSEAVLFVSVRPRHPYLMLVEGKGPKAAPEGTRSPFDLAISKHLKGARLLEIETLPRERVAVLWFTAEGRTPEQERLGLVLWMVPAVPEALLVKVPAGTRPEDG